MKEHACIIILNSIYKRGREKGSERECEREIEKGGHTHENIHGEALMIISNSVPCCDN